LWLRVELLAHATNTRATAMTFDFAQRGQCVGLPSPGQDSISKNAGSLQARPGIFMVWLVANLSDMPREKSLPE
jgi:hypothetical protein